MGIEAWKIPGRFQKDVAFLDIETRKVPTDLVILPSGGTMRSRWSAYMIGIARDGILSVVTDRMTGPSSEISTLASVGSLVANVAEVRYAAGREFDEMILRGRFTNARRAHLPTPTFPAVPGAESFNWANMQKLMLQPYVRAPDITSRECATPRPDLMNIILLHNIRDVIELILATGNPSSACELWGARMLGDSQYASKYIREESI